MDCDIIIIIINIIAYVILHVMGNITDYDIICLDDNLILLIIVNIIYDIIDII
jgi:hypothetical protein